MAVFGIISDVYDGDMFVNGKPRQKNQMRLYLMMAVLL